MFGFEYNMLSLRHQRREKEYEKGFLSRCSRECSERWKIRSCTRSIVKLYSHSQVTKNHSRRTTKNHHRSLGDLVPLVTLYKLLFDYIDLFFPPVTFRLSPLISLACACPPFLSGVYFNSRKVSAKNFPRIARFCLRLWFGSFFLF